MSRCRTCGVESENPDDFCFVNGKEICCGELRNSKYDRATDEPTESC